MAGLTGDPRDEGLLAWVSGDAADNADKVVYAAGKGGLGEDGYTLNADQQRGEDEVLTMREVHHKGFCTAAASFELLIKHTHLVTVPLSSFSRWILLAAE